MNYTQEQQSQFIREFAKRKRRQLYAVPLVIAAVAVLAVSEQQVSIGGLSSEVIGPVFFAVIAAAVVLSLFNWRCPACNKYLGKGIPQYCPKCGVQLQHEE